MKTNSLAWVAVAAAILTVATIALVAPPTEQPGRRKWLITLRSVAALVLLPVAAIGHVLGLKAHEYLLHNDALFKRVIGGALLLICVIGLGGRYAW